MGISIVRERLRNRAHNGWGPGGGAPGSSGVLYILVQFDGLICLYMYTSRSGTGWTLSFPFFLLLLPSFFFYAKKWGGTCPPAPPPLRADQWTARPDSWLQKLNSQYSCYINKQWPGRKADWSVWWVIMIPGAEENICNLLFAVANLESKTQRQSTIPFI